MSKEIEYKVKQKMLKVQEVAEAGYAAEQRFTYEDYCTWPDDERWELIDGIPFKMDAPSRYHQKISVNVLIKIANFLVNKTCEVYHAPFDVRLNVGEGKDTVVQPDIVVICDRNHLDHKGAKGAPEFVIEILSPSTVHHDRVRKLEKYQQYGVKEYWIVDPISKTVAVYLFEITDLTIYEMGAEIEAAILPGFSISLKDIFADE